MNNEKGYQDIIDILPKGKENAQNVKVLSELYGMNLRVFQKMLHDARIHGIIICSSNEGIYIPSNREEVKRFYKRYHSHALSTLSMLKTCRQYLKDTEEQE